MLVCDTKMVTRGWMRRKLLHIVDNMAPKTLKRLAQCHYKDIGAYLDQIKEMEDAE